MTSFPLMTRNSSSSSSCACHTNSPWTFAILTSCPLVSPMIFGDHCSSNFANFSLRVTLFMACRATQSGDKYPHSLECRFARQLLANDQLMNRLRTLVRDDRFQVQRMPNRVVFQRDAGAAEQIARVARDVDRHADVVPFRHRDLRGIHPAGVLEAAELQAQELRLRDPARHVRHADLNGLGMVDAPAEKHALAGVVEHF